MTNVTLEGNCKSKREKKNNDWQSEKDPPKAKCKKCEDYQNGLDSRIGAMIRLEEMWTFSDFGAEKSFPTKRICCMFNACQSEYCHRWHTNQRQKNPRYIRQDQTVSGIRSFLALKTQLFLRDVSLSVQQLKVITSKILLRLHQPSLECNFLVL